MDPYGETNGVLNINTQTGMKGTTGCKWTDNAYFDDPTKTDWSQDNISFEQCNVLCSQKLEGKRDKNFLKFSPEKSKYIETGKICGFEPKQNGKGLCSIKTGGEVVGNATQGSIIYGRKLTKCNDIFEKASEVTPEVCGFKKCKGRAYDGCNGSKCITECDKCGDAGAGCDNFKCKQECCGTGKGDGDGVTGCASVIFQTPKCLDNNDYPCYYAPEVSLKEFPWCSAGEINYLYSKANEKLPNNYTASTPTKHRSTC